MYALVLWAAALATAYAAVRRDYTAFIGNSLRFTSRRSVDLPQGRRRDSPASTPVASTSMSLLRTFEASELQLQRFIGELGFVEITDWCVFLWESYCNMCACKP